MKEGCFRLGDYNPCNMPPFPPVEHSGPQFEMLTFLFISGLFAVPLMLLTVGMAVVASRKVQTPTFATLLEAWLVPPSLLTAIILISDIADRGIERVSAHFFSAAGMVEMLPLVTAFYLASFLATYLYYRFRRCRSLNERPNE